MHVGHKKNVALKNGLKSRPTSRYNTGLRFLPTFNHPPPELHSLARNTAGFSKLLTVLALVIIVFFGFILWHANNRTYATHEIAIGISQSFVDVNNEFGIKVFKSLVNDSLTNNVLISPVSIETALSILYNGSAGSSTANMTTTLDYKGLNKANINKSNQALLLSLSHPDQALKLSIGNSVWISSHYRPNRAFVDIARNDYLAQVDNLNFNNPASSSTINAWLTKLNNGQLSTPIKALSAADELDLVNSTVFNSSWFNAFNPSLIHNADFTNSSNVKVQVPFMSQTGVYNFFQTKQYQWLELPFGKNQRLSMDIILPNSLQSYVHNFSYQQLIDSSSQFNTGQVQVTIPEFNLAYQKNLNSLFIKMGLANLYSNQANFSQISNGLRLSNFIQQAYVNFSYKGFNAPSVNSSTDSVFNFDLNHPFLFTIIDNSTKYILFIGYINQP